MAACDLCDLPTPDPPVTAGGADGVFCCRGCLEVAARLDDAEPADAGAVRDALGDGDAEGGEDAETAFLAVDGMHCSTCEAFLESEATEADGVVGAEASYAADLVKLSYDPDRIAREDLPGVITGFGYTARDAEAPASGGGETPPWRLLVGVFLGMPLMAWYAVFLYPRYFGVVPESPAWTGATGTTSLVNLWVLSTIILGVTGYPILRGAYVSLRAGRPNMDLLVALAAVNAYVYSTAVLALGGTEVYFDIAVVIVVVVTLGNRYEERIKRRASGTLADLAERGVDGARRRIPDGTETVPVDALDAGDEVVVKPGERVPVDGTVVEGTAAADESLLTGESLPVRKDPGADVVGGSIVADGALVVEVPEGATSTADRLVALLWDVQSSRPGAQRLADRVAAVFVPLVLAVAVVAAAWQFAGGAGITDALLSGLTVLVVSCPCALGLATPLAVASGVRAGLDGGVVVTDAAAFESAGAADVVAFDKTGTLTTGEMRVVDADDGRALELAAAVEAYSSHPVADAVASHVAPSSRSVSGFERHPGRGVSADVDGERVVVGRPGLFDERGWPVSDDLRERAADAEASGHVPVVVGWDGRARSLVVVGDEPREGWAGVVSTFAERGHEVVVITGDGEAAAGRFRDHPAVGRVFADVPPEAKAGIVERLRTEGTVAMVGDGTNDAPALAAADFGIALSTGTAVAADAADAVVRSGDLAGVVAAFDVTRETNRRIRGNLGWAFLYNAVAIPVAALGLLNPLVAAVAMAASSLLVVANSARPFDGSGDRPSGGSQSSDGRPPAPRGTERPS